MTIDTTLNRGPPDFSVSKVVFIPTTGGIIFSILAGVDVLMWYQLDCQQSICKLLWDSCWIIVKYYLRIVQVKIPFGECSRSWSDRIDHI